MSKFWIWLLANLPIMAVYACAWVTDTHPKYGTVSTIVATLIVVIEVAAITIVMSKNKNL